MNATESKPTVDIETHFHSTPQVWTAARKGYCGCGECKFPLGLGKTKEGAVADLLEQEASRHD